MTSQAGKFARLSSQGLTELSGEKNGVGARLLLSLLDIPLFSSARSNLPRATITFSKPFSRRPTSPPFRASGSAKSLFLTQRSQRKLGQCQCHEAPRNPSRQPTLKHSLASNTSIAGQPFRNRESECETGIEASRQEGEEKEEEDESAPCVAWPTIVYCGNYSVHPCCS